MKKLKSFLSLLGIALIVGMIFNFISHGSIFPEKPKGLNELTTNTCEMHFKDAYIEMAKQKGDKIDYAQLDAFSKKVCNCAIAKSKSNSQLRDAISQCIYE
ncbi:TPA: hypothetical protein QBZ85_001090 [Pasteurella multocida]|nr:hypothetical protein [Pasteurella multocida]HDR0675401.1 hypothetical protein [Pasteurella multocida]HDR0677832.1 hypothetical protein [Pasteurella multocida]HDR0680998.1 hypothetical protein [Pasteurella multocida]HDR0681895.1 hypothetical protein [Pasteurella multocida]